MQYRKIAGIEKPVSAMFYGCANDRFNGGQNCDDILDQVYAMGVNAFDNARVYGDSEKVLGKWLDSRGLYDKVVILSKGAHPTAPLMIPRVSEKAIRADWRTSSEYLRTSFIDIYLLHRDDVRVPVGNIVEILNAMHAEGKIGIFGGSNWTTERIQEANEYAYKHDMMPFLVSSPHFSLAHQAKDPWGGGCTTITGPENAASYEWYQKNQMPVIAYSSLANGFFSGRIPVENTKEFVRSLSPQARKAFVTDDNLERLRRCQELAGKKNCSVSQLALAWIYHQDVNAFAIATSTNADRMKANIAALEISLTDEESRYLNLK